MILRAAVIGLGTFGSELAKELAKNGIEVIAIDRTKDRIDALDGKVSKVKKMDTSKEKNIRLLKEEVGDMDAIVITIGERSVEDSILTTFLLSSLSEREGGPDIYVRTVNDIHKQIIERIGVKKTFNPEVDYADKLAQSMSRNSILDVFSVSIDDNYIITDMETPSDWVGKTIRELDLRNQHGLTILSIKRRSLKIEAGGQESIKTRIEHNPPAHATIQRRDILVCFGELKKVEEAVQKSKDSSFKST